MSASGSGYWDTLHHHTDLDEIWLSHPLVRARVNSRISGDPDTWPTAWLASRLRERLPLERTASIGCGIGNFERGAVSLGLVGRIVGIDSSPSCIEEATSLARDGGFGGITYYCGDAREWLKGQAGLDGVFFHQSLHHFDRLDELFRLAAAALRPGGFLMLDEYVGPARNEWRFRDLLLHNLAYRLLPRTVRRAGLVRAPINRDDPTEAINSSQILTSVARHFEVLDRRDYGGNLLSVIYPNLRRPTESPGSPPAVFDRAITRLLDLEEWCLRHPRLTGSKAYYTCVIARTPAGVGQ